MENITRKSDSSQPAAETGVYLFDDWFDPIEARVRDRVREFIQALVEICGNIEAASSLRKALDDALLLAKTMTQDTHH